MEYFCKTCGKQKGIEAPTQPLKTALAERNLTLDLAPAQWAAVVWQIRTMK